MEIANNTLVINPENSTESGIVCINIVTSLDLIEREVRFSLSFAEQTAGIMCNEYIKVVKNVKICVAALTVADNNNPRIKSC